MKFSVAKLRVVIWSSPIAWRNGYFKYDIIKYVLFELQILIEQLANPVNREVVATDNELAGDTANMASPVQERKK